MTEHQKQRLLFLAALLLAGLILSSLMGCYLTKPVVGSVVVTRAYFEDGMWCWKHLTDENARLEVCSFTGGDEIRFTYADVYVNDRGSTPRTSTNE